MIYHHLHFSNLKWVSETVKHNCSFNFFEMLFEVFVWTFIIQNKSIWSLIIVIVFSSHFSGRKTRFHLTCSIKQLLLTQSWQTNTFTGLQSTRWHQSLACKFPRSWVCAGCPVLLLVEKAWGGVQREFESFQLLKWKQRKKISTSGSYFIFFTKEVLNQKKNGTSSYPFGRLLKKKDDERENRIRRKSIQNGVGFVFVKWHEREELTCDSNMTFTSPSTTGPFFRLMMTALLPTSGNT